MTKEGVGGGEVIYLSEELQRAEREAREKEEGISADNLIKQSGELKATRSALEKGETDLFIKANNAFKEGKLPVEQMLVIIDNLSEPVFKAASLRNCIAEVVRRGEVGLAEELLAKEPDPSNQERDRGTIAIVLAEAGKRDESNVALEKMSKGHWKDNAVRVIKMNRDKGAGVSAFDDLSVN